MSIDTAYLLIYGHLPTGEQLDRFSNLLTEYSPVHENMRIFFQNFPPMAHAMGIQFMLDRDPNEKEFHQAVTEVVESVRPVLEQNPLWEHPAKCAFPSATQNEINENDAYSLISGGVILVSEGANMPCTPEAVDLFLDKGFFYGPGKAANAGGVAVSGLEMTQNGMRLAWTRQEVDDRLKMIMASIHNTCMETAEQYGTPGNYVNGANIAGFVKVADAMIDQGVVQVRKGIDN